MNVKRTFLVHVSTGEVDYPSVRLSIPAGLQKVSPFHSLQRHTLWGHKIDRRDEISPEVHDEKAYD
jgi:hypothetical protein